MKANIDIDGSGMNKEIEIVSNCLCQDRDWFQLFQNEHFIYRSHFGLFSSKICFDDSPKRKTQRKPNSTLSRDKKNHIEKHMNHTLDGPLVI